MTSVPSLKTQDSAGVLVIARSTSLHPGRPVLLGQRSKNVRAPFTWAPWGGRLNHAEAPEQGAVREFREESGYRGSIELMPESHWEYRCGVGPVNLFTFHNFIGLVEDQFASNFDRWEVADAKWFSLEEIDELPGPGWSWGGEPGGIHRGLRAYLRQRRIRSLVTDLLRTADSK
ncbi:MAG: NUDIX hydrolase [Gemmataceae bacterium]